MPLQGVCWSEAGKMQVRSRGAHSLKKEGSWRFARWWGRDGGGAQCRIAGLAALGSGYVVQADTRCSLRWCAPGNN